VPVAGHPGNLGPRLVAEAEHLSIERDHLATGVPLLLIDT
jgi:hypothetical protein